MTSDPFSVPWFTVFRRSRSLLCRLSSFPPSHAPDSTVPHTRRCCCCCDWIWLPRQPEDAPCGGLPNKAAAVRVSSSSAPTRWAATLTADPYLRISISLGRTFDRTILHWIASFLFSPSLSLYRSIDFFVLFRESKCYAV